MCLDEHDRMKPLGGDMADPFGLLNDSFEEPSQRLYIVLEEAPVVTDLKREVDCLLGSVAALKEELRRASTNRSYEQAINSELIDVLRSNGIKYRPGVDFRTWCDELKI